MLKGAFEFPFIILVVVEVDGDGLGISFFERKVQFVLFYVIQAARSKRAPEVPFLTIQDSFFVQKDGASVFSDFPDGHYQIDYGKEERDDKMDVYFFIVRLYVVEREGQWQ